jgi:hypothetical protein
MISEPDDIREALFKTTAGELLRVPPNAARSEVCTALLRKVQEAEFVPEPGLTYGAELLGGFEPPRRQSRADHSESVEALAGECERSLREQVEQFAATFFSLPVYERRWHFDQLQEQVEGFPRVETRLRVLEEGLSIDLDDLRGESPQMVELAQRVCALHVLRPQARAQLRQAMHRDLEADGRDWEKAARYLRRNWNPISCLAPEFINPLAIMTKKRRQLTAKHKRVMTQGVKIRTTSTRAGWTARAAGPAIVLVLIGLFNFVTRQWEEHPRPVRIPTRDYKPYSKPFEMPLLDH